MRPWPPLIGTFTSASPGLAVCFSLPICTEISSPRHEIRHWRNKTEEQAGEDEEHEEEEDAGRKRRSGWSHMTMYDEGMMDEGAASLRDRDMIAGRRGGPSVRYFSLSFTLEWLVQCVSPFPRSARNTRELEPPLSPVWPILLSYSTDTGEAALLRRIYTFSFWIFILNNLFVSLIFMRNMKIGVFDR